MREQLIHLKTLPVNIHLIYVLAQRVDILNFLRNNIFTLAKFENMFATIDYSQSTIR